MQDNNSQTLFFLGSGNMASAIGRGLVAQNSSLNLGFYDQAWAKALAMTVELPGTKSTRSLPDAVAFADVLLLAVKPQDMPALVDELADAFAFLVPVYQYFQSFCRAGLEDLK